MRRQFAFATAATERLVPKNSIKRPLRHMLQGFFVFSDLIGNRRPSLQKSSIGHIKLPTTQGGGPWGSVIMGEVWGDLSFLSGGRGVLGLRRCC